MANEFDLEKMKNEANDPNGLDIKLSAFENKEKTSDADIEAEAKPEPDVSETEVAVETVAVGADGQKSKADIAKMIAWRLAEENGDDDEPIPVSQANVGGGVKTATRTEPKKAEVYDDYEDKKAKPVKSSKSKKKSEKKSVAGLFLAFFGGLVGVALLAFYVGGLVMTSGKFLPGTTINGKDVSMMTASQAAMIFENDDKPQSLVLYKNDGTSVEISHSSIEYKTHTDETIQKLLDEKNGALWFVSLVKPTSYKNIDVEAATFSDLKLKGIISSEDWGDREPENAQIKASDNGFVISPEVDGQTIDKDKLFEHIKEQLKIGNTDAIRVSAVTTLTKPEIVAKDLEEEVKRKNTIANMVITIDFDYTTEQLKGTDFGNWVTFNEDGSLNVDRSKIEGYVDELAKKYDTYNTPRKFKATLQGDITVPISDDAKYGWWIYKEKTVDLLIKLINEGNSVTTDPVYYYTENADGSKGYEFTGREAARTAGDDIGNTYVEIDLSAQTLWHYVDGEMVYTCGIVSGQPNPSARKTLPGVYKVWFKARNYTMKSSNSAGESWTANCAYWTRVAIVGVGLHDSQWRGNNVGGQIYKTNGSHGCINMTLSGAKYIYDNVEYGTPVVMYY